MSGRSGLVGRRAERDRLTASLEQAALGRGSLLLMSGDAGIGKTRLAGELAEGADALVLSGSASHAGTAPYGPIAAALRCYLRSAPDGLSDCGPLRQHLALILPELGEPPSASDRPTLFEAVRCAFAHLARERHALVLLDDLQWSDEATLELLSALAAALDELPVLVIAAYRSDGLPRDHGLRRLRNELRRSGHLDELTLAPLDLPDTAALLAEALASPPSPALARAIHDRTEGVPFFVEELAAALALTAALQPGPRGLELAGSGDIPLPDTVRDAVLIGASELSPDARAAAEVAAVAGERFDLDVVGHFAADAGLSELIGHGMLSEDGAGGARFRHALTRDALYADVPWMRRRCLHRELAQAMEQAGAGSREVASQWEGARDPARAREALLRAAEESEAVHAYRDAAAADRKALDLWPEDDEGEPRGRVLERYARCSQLSGDLAEAARAWREVAAIRRSTGDGVGMADAQRSLAAVHELRGERESAFAVRRTAVEAYAANGRPAEASAEHLAMANYLRLAARHGDAIELARTAREQADAAGRLDLRIRAIGLEGLATAKHGEYREGLEIVRGGLALALEHDLTAIAAELYQRLSVVLYDSADYRRAQDALATALDLCRASGDAGAEVACVTCMIYVLRDRGEWGPAAEMSRELIAGETAVWVAQGLLGTIHAFQGKLASGRKLLTSSLATSTRVSHYNLAVDSTSALASVAAAEGADDEAAEHCRTVLRRWSDSDDHHYAVWGLRWAVTFFAQRRDTDGAHACVEALARIASETGHPDALAALATAIGETALVEGDADTAAEQLSRAVEIHRTLDMPFERAQIELRAGVALCAAGEREIGLERLCDAYRSARKLGARPLAAQAAGEVAALGESVIRRLGRRAAAEAGGAGLSRRELEVVRLLAAGRTNREIAQDLFLSPRTVDMHVRNILRKLDCRSRVEAAGRAAELGVLA